VYKKVVWATDGSEAADIALAHAKTLTSDAGGQLFIVHCAEYIRPGVRGGHYAVAVDEEELEARFERQAGELGAGGIQASAHVIAAGAGGAAHAIADFAKGENADVIVVGTRGHTALAGLLLGSVTQRLLHVAPCPVLAVPPAER
jgi:nucleotide-binding universal stress UspA family protein